ncbi:hypothetical protein [Streptomyces marispadix]|uniref:Uncharacterized protein n=1 Tax=Streptomyces marispadix TaxID=2922868 RepID=A0ABS9T4G1_9ACTN|nr:hypothetical protein [Streptomyces marispadix]MCH6163313.1 hypothetical protein [Streptomyces marispadix]
MRETNSLTVLDGDGTVYVARVQGSRMLTVSIAVGTLSYAVPPAAAGRP